MPFIAKIESWEYFSNMDSFLCSDLERLWESKQALQLLSFYKNNKNPIEATMVPHLRDRLDKTW